MTRTVGLYLFDDVEVLDFAGPYEVFSTASRVQSRLDPQSPMLFEVVTIADDKRIVCARGGLKVLPDVEITAHPHLDVLVIPGGIVTAELKRDGIIDWIARTASTTQITASVCTGAFLLGKAGLLKGKPATTHWEDLDDFHSMFPEIRVQAEARWVDVGQIMTSAGISAGIDMSLHLVSRLESQELAVKTARQMEYDWQVL
ncbi:MAG TPA: DJ-1/PfpI family protein [Anaerolineales bacterium]|nr:DJ-1/PfpI family protein [Anaerolineales bacterium]